VPGQKRSDSVGQRQPLLRTGLKERLAPSPTPPHTASVPDEAWKREDVNALLAGVWDIKMLLLQLVQHLGDDEDEEDE
jgi:hypothetical protein